MCAVTLPIPLRHHLTGSANSGEKYNSIVTYENCVGVSIGGSWKRIKIVHAHENTHGAQLA